jgi:outer membrane protein
MRLLLCSLALCVAATPLAAQTPAPAAVGPVLTLDEALNIARRNNPTFLQTTEGRRRASAAVRSAYGNLLPDISSNFATQFRQGRPQLINGVAFGASGDQISSSYGINASLSLNQAALLGPKAERASAAATEAEIAAGAQTLRMQVTQQYLLALQQRARARLQDTLVATTQAQFELARIRQSVGSATPLDVQQAEVALGQQRVAALQAQNQAEVEKLRLFQLLGVAQPEGVQLTTEFPVDQPQLSLDQLLALAREQNPTLTALRARRRASDIGVTQAKGEYMPTLNVNTGIGGYTSQFTDDDFLIGQRMGSIRQGCESENSLRELVGLPPTTPDCSALTLSPEQIANIRSGNRAFPFDFTQTPWSISASLSLPIFNGFSREQRVQEAQVQRNEAQYRARAQELQLTADVSAAYLTLMSDYQAVQLQEQNARTARQALALAQERYRVGASNFVELSQARDAYSRAEADRINAIYEFHRAYAALEGAVGRSLR